MTKVYSKALDRTIEVERFIGHHQGMEKGPTLIFLAGIHGNEPAGIFALHQALDEINKRGLKIKGNVYALSGNLWALEKGVRYHKQDLNRLWTTEVLKKLLKNQLLPKDKDSIEQIELYHEITNILKKEQGPFYFMDLHTTSGKTVPFALLNDSLLNRKFVAQYPVPLILGIEEYLEGPLLSYINELGYIAFGYESGQHDDLAAIQNHVAFIYLTLVFTGSLKKKEIDYRGYFKMLGQELGKTQEFYEIFYRYRVKEDENFVMRPGYSNFQHLSKGQEIAIGNGGNILAHKKGKIFMPLYQRQGREGFFIIRKIPIFFLGLSSIMRKIQFDTILPCLPGVQWLSPDRNALIVDKGTARFFSKPFFHLLGYRGKEIDETHLVVKNREKKSRKRTYRNAPWY
ncbi:MAG: succinylglutamate desuccinylase/aspartoacylase family protein [Bacteroidota bacterium]